MKKYTQNNLKFSVTNLCCSHLNSFYLFDWKSYIHTGIVVNFWSLVVPMSENVWKSLKIQLFSLYFKLTKLKGPRKKKYVKSETNG